jgi:hypothetical protein
MSTRPRMSSKPSILRRNTATSDGLNSGCRSPNLKWARRDHVMRVYLFSCIIAALVAMGAVYALNAIQKDANVAYSTTAVRI